MKIINREMGGGKTHALVEIMLRPGNEDVIYVAPTRDQAYRIAYEYAKTIRPGISRSRFITAADIEHNRLGHRYVFDEVHAVLSTLVGTEVVAIAGTDEDLAAGQLKNMGADREAEWNELGKNLYLSGLDIAEAATKILYKKDAE